METLLCTVVMHINLIVSTLFHIVFSVATAGRQVWNQDSSIVGAVGKAEVGGGDVPDARGGARRCCGGCGGCSP